MTDTQNILSFWFDDHGPADWFKKDDRFDTMITEKFTAAYESRKDLTPDDIFAASAAEHPKDRAAQARYILAHIILFDQFPRNMFRNDPRAFATDALALGLGRKMIDRQLDLELDTDSRVFAYMPFMHSENMQDQKTSVALYEGLGGNTSENLRFARLHLEVIEEFGRFPHRNKILGRVSTVAEEDYLQKPGAGF